MDMMDQREPGRAEQPPRTGAVPGRPILDRDTGDEDLGRPSAEVSPRVKRPTGNQEINVESEGALGAAGTGGEERSPTDEERRRREDAKLRAQNEGD